MKSGESSPTIEQPWCILCGVDLDTDVEFPSLYCESCLDAIDQLYD